MTKQDFKELEKKAKNKQISDDELWKWFLNLTKDDELAGQQLEVIKIFEEYRPELDEKFTGLLNSNW